MMENELKSVRDCFTENGDFVIEGFDPCRCPDSGIHRVMYNLLFDEDGYAHSHAVYEVSNLIRKKNWGVWSDAVKYYYASECIDNNCKGNYTAIYAWRH